MLRHIDRIIEEFTFENMQRKNPAKCVCYYNTPCHDLPKNELNCFFCYCPHYDNASKVGKCGVGNGKITKDIRDCSDCIYPHRKEFVKERLGRIFS